MDEMPQIDSDDFMEPSDPNKVYDPKEIKASKIANDDSLSEPEKIDALADLRGWFRAHHPAIAAYHAGELTADEAAEKIAGPIDEAYSTGDHGMLRYSSEETARYQRQFCSDPEEAAEHWGWPEEVTKPDVDEDLASTEGHLWDLWYAVLHAAKKIPWTEEVEQEKLLKLVKALNARPDPPQPDNMTVAMKQDWVWAWGGLWSSLILLGPASRESLNDSCGCGAGWQEPEQRAQTNWHAFLARLTASGIAGYGTYCMYAMEDALETNPTSLGSHHRPPETEVKVFSDLTVAAVWVLIAGEWLYHNKLEDDGGIDGEEVDLSLRGKKLPWLLRKDHEFVRRVLSAGRWTFWRRRFAQEADNRKLTEEVRDLCKRAAKEIADFETK